LPVILAEDLTRVFVSHQRKPGIAGAAISLFSRQKKEVLAADRVNVKVEAGELVGFLGPNGAGKTTTLKMLSGILFPTSGRAEVLGFTPWERRNGFKRQFSLVMGQKNQLWWDLPAEESFLLLKELYEIPAPDYRQRVKTMTELLEIDHLLGQQVRKLSLGERMKCELVAALLHRPRVVFLDEPTIGLDVVSQKRIREFISMTNRQEGSTIILTSHYMDDVRALCDRVVIIDHGRVIFDDSLGRLVAQFTDTKQLRLTFHSPVAAGDLEPFGRVTEREDLSAALEIKRDEAPRVAAALLARLPVMDIEITDPDIQDVIRDIFQRKPDLEPQPREGP
jgi:ABC-2 type transport system ATP-binding protein